MSAPFPFPLGSESARSDSACLHRIGEQRSGQIRDARGSSCRTGNRLVPPRESQSPRGAKVYIAPERFAARSHPTSTGFRVRSTHAVHRFFVHPATAQNTDRNFRFVESLHHTISHKGTSG